MNRHAANEGPAAVATGVLTGVLSYITHLNWIGIVGLLVSAGWLGIGLVRLHWERIDRRAHSIR